MMVQKPTYLILVILLMWSCVPVTPSQVSTTKRLIYDNAEYESNVGMVQLFPYTEGLQSDLENPIIKIGSTQPLYLQFDLFQDNYTPLQAKYIHCNADWRPSGLADIRILDQYNAFDINDYTYSANTRENYVSYEVQLPVPNISGNYILVVHRSSSDQDIILSRRVMFFENLTGLNPKLSISSAVKSRPFNHQIEFSLSYSALDQVNPLRDLSVVILQNHNWNTALTGLQPTLLRHDEKYMEYYHFNAENNFPGGNEFRFFDLRSIDFRGINVLNIQKGEERILALLTQDKPRGKLAYAQLQGDINGHFFLVNSDPGDSQRNSEYTDVYFELKSEPVDGDIFIHGRFNNWRLESKNRMTYDAERESYRGVLRLKQGYYNYQYVLRSETLPSSHLEGNFYQTQNDYEILVYYRSPVRNYDQLVGYKLINSRL